MALTGAGTEPARSEMISPGWAFQMKDGRGATIQVFVTDLAIENIGSGGSGLEDFQAHRSEIEKLASEKHARL